jgi:hypothetical protein
MANVEKICALLNESVNELVNRVPEDRTLVVLGRDAWPLVPLLRARGRRTQYFLMSRLQTRDVMTANQYLREVPPHSVLVDTGYAGSIIDAVRQFDPTAAGVLMSSTGRYPALLKERERTAIVGELEYSAKLIGRTRTYTRNGVAVAGKSFEADRKPSRHVIEWNQQLLEKLNVARDAMEKFVGLTPWQRIGCRPDEVVPHYKRVLWERIREGQSVYVDDLPAAPEDDVEFGEFYPPKSIASIAKDKDSKFEDHEEYSVYWQDGVQYMSMNEILMLDWDFPDAGHPKKCLTGVENIGDVWLLLHEWCKSFPYFGFALYETPGGARAFCTNQFFSPTAEFTQHVMKKLKCDPVYAGMCSKKNAFCVRVSPKLTRKNDFIARYVGQVGSLNLSTPIRMALEKHDALVDENGGNVKYYGDLIYPFLNGKAMPF